MTKQKLVRKAFCSVVTAFFVFSGAAFSQGSPTTLSPIELPSLTPVDLTPVNMNREQQLLNPGYTYYLFQNLPSRLWFNVTTETSQRYESNVFFSRTRYRSDYVYRILPNVTLGYEGFKKVSIYSNYFALKDVFVGHNQLTFPTTQSISGGLRRNFTFSPKTNIQLDFQARELFQSVHLHQADLIPGMTVTRFVTPHAIVYTNLLLQLRGKDYFVAPTREIDPFYTIGGLYTKGSWMFTAVSTLVTNFRHPPFNDAIPNQSNKSIICDFEVSHPIPKLPYMVGFVRAEPIFNWDGKGVQGLSGMDFRLFSGLRLSLAKPTYNASISKLKQQLKEFNASEVDDSGLPEPIPKTVPHSKMPVEPPHDEIPSDTTPESSSVETPLDSATKDNPTMPIATEPSSVETPLESDAKDHLVIPIAVKSPSEETLVDPAMKDHLVIPVTVNSLSVEAPVDSAAKDAPVTPVEVTSSPTEIPVDSATRDIPVIPIVLKRVSIDSLVKTKLDPIKVDLAVPIVKSSLTESPLNSSSKVNPVIPIVLERLSIEYPLIETELDSANNINQIIPVAHQQRPTTERSSVETELDFADNINQVIPITLERLPAPNY